MMQTKALLIIMSHLSDAEEGANNSLRVIHHIEFAKFLMLELKGDLTQEIDADEMYAKFRKNKEWSDRPCVSLEEIKAFALTDKEIRFTIEGCLSNREKLKAVKYLIDKGKAADVRIGLKDAKDYVDALQVEIENA